MQVPLNQEYGAPIVKPKSRVKLLVLLIVGMVLVPPVIYTAFVMFFAQPVKVAGVSMSPTLNDGDRIFIWKRFASINRGDIVVFLFPENQSKSLIMRVVALPGETIDMNGEGRIAVDGRALAEPYLEAERDQSAAARWTRVREEFKRTSPDGYFVMGDNRDRANDSRTWGRVPRSLIYGKFLSRYWPFFEPVK